MLDPMTGKDVGRNIPGGFGREPIGVAQMPWPDHFHIQGGTNGLVFRPAPDEGEEPTYTTAFVEVFPGGTFLRGEGKTIAEAEVDCWGKYQRWISCPGPTGEHSWKPGYTAKNGRWVGYHNGAGFCEHCHAFASGKFTAEQLGQFCHVCSTPTMWTWKDQPDGTTEFFCKEHATDRDSVWLRAQQKEDAG